jgi:hypothetical protein
LQAQLPGPGRFYVFFRDDIAIWSNSIEDHIKHIRLILDALREHGLVSKEKSIQFADAGISGVRYLVEGS